MKKIRFLANLMNEIRRSDRELTERIYLALSVISEIMVFFALIGDFIVKENPIEIAILILVLIFVPLFAWFGLRWNCISFFIKLTVIIVNFGILPGLFFFGGGLRGGGVLWIIFGFTYAGLVLTGRWRKVILVVIILLALLFYILDYYCPELVYKHTSEDYHIDSYFSIVLVGVICFVMTWLQNRLLQAENLRAKKAAEVAEELTRSQNRFFSSMSHEIRTPINSILGLNELILRDKDASDEIIRDASGIQGSGKMLLSLINDILDFSKMEAGNMEIVPVDYRIGDMLSDVVNMIWIKADEKGLDFRVTVDPNVPVLLYGDEVRIKQVIVNLLNNAVKYTAKGSVELRVESDQRDEDSTELTISVSDTGMGIKKESLPYLFDVFRRVDEEKNRHIEGTGLGLSIVKQLVELMGGNITVNSVYGEGSTFTVTLSQGISDHTKIGNLNIRNQGAVRRVAYECSFRAPEARILIVDDNEMNLEVECKLLADTEIQIDKASGGKEALELTLSHQYDTILMDHLMPEMDGIECFERMRAQVGGLNRITPVVVLTANAGSSNRELYNRAGFDGYLVKPVSGEALENTLIRFIPKDKLIVNSNKMMTTGEGMNTSTGYSGKASVIITSTSMCDLPDSMIQKLNIPILPFMIRTEEGLFKDGVQMGADEMMRYLNAGKNAESVPPNEATYTEFFASNLRHAHHLIHISLTTSMSDDYYKATEAAKSFDNVTVINSGSISSATGLLVLIAHKLAQMNLSAEEIMRELETVKERLKCSFIIDTTEFMAKKGLVSRKVDRMARNLNLHPCLRVKNDKTGIGGIWFGERMRAYKKYIAKAFPVDVIPDQEIVFVTFVDVPLETLAWIKEEISRYAYFENVVFKQASAAISTNCGPGAFGILYFVKSNKSYNLSSYIDTEASLFTETLKGEKTLTYNMAMSEDTEAEGAEEAADAEEIEAAEERAEEVAKEDAKWYETIEGIDGSIAIKNSGSEESFKTVLRIFYDSIDSKAEELEGYFEAADWKDYTIKVHALKSSAKLIGAMETSEKAQLLENAGKEEDETYIRQHHASLMKEYKQYKEALKPVFQTEYEEKKPEADPALMESVYEGLREAAETMDCDAVEEIMSELSSYAIPQSEQEKFALITEAAACFDYVGILNAMRE